jgi:hypothetical protein
MGWSETGDARVKRFRVYQELERKFSELQAHCAGLEAELARKDATIRHLATELASMPGMASAAPVSPSEALLAEEATDTTPNAASLQGELPSQQRTQTIMPPRKAGPPPKRHQSGTVPMSHMYGAILPTPKTGRR